VEDAYKGLETSPAARKRSEGWGWWEQQHQKPLRKIEWSIKNRAMRSGEEKLPTERNGDEEQVREQTHGQGGLNPQAYAAEGEGEEDGRFRSRTVRHASRLGRDVEFFLLFFLAEGC
jgi:hypothetical protein